ncbi:DUF92 domain-containing protein [Thermomicrobium sp. CFH 73360]|uniref:DUF92 domain-containing protein n=1 Tax=Thermomicrobium sp. CFH 73360 TaxID=2951987 RepID=UPI0020776578|nr:DUF92 domain-containing protein [Thermomicrobium sp. CFH 73360]MCM8746809.1 DUF92 domain-containing protein [Thermomicrobium sp. CFH 73360]
MNHHLTRLPLRLALGGGLATLVGLLAYRYRALDGGGALAAAGTGTLVFAAGGLSWSASMFGFFIAASTLTRLGGTRKRSLAALRREASRPRTATQVLANGGVAATLAALQILHPGDRDYTLPYLAALAAASADTWATELGVLSPSPPRSLRTGRPVPPGTSGAISPLGSLAMVAGAFFVALLAPRRLPRWPVVTAGSLGAILDSLLGAMLQARYHCPHCQCILENPQHDCTGRVRRVSGLPGMTNDLVNALATFAAALLALLLTPGQERSRRSASTGS